MKKWSWKLMAISMMFASVACSDNATGNGSQRLVVAATAVPHAEILEHIKPTLKAQGVDLEIRVFNDYVQPNSQVAQQLIDVNYFQTGPYLHAYNRDHQSDLVEVVGVHIEPFGAYSRRHRSLNALPANAEVAIPNDPSNGGRALLLLQQADVIRLNDPANALSTLADIRENPKQLRFRELDAAMLPRVLDQVDLALINTNYALDAGLNPMADALVIENRQSPYVNYLVGRPDNRDDPRVKMLAAALTSADNRNFIEQKYRGAVLPAFLP